MKIDPYDNKRKFENFEKKRLVDGTSKANSDIILEYLKDMKSGYNTARKKPLTYIRLNNIRQRLSWTVRMMEEQYKVTDITKIQEKQAIDFFNNMMRNGIIKKLNGTQYTSIDSYTNVFKSFWHWYMRRENGNGKAVKDITIYIDTSPVKESTFAFFTIDDLRKVCNRAKYKYRVLMWFLFDSGIRAPTELTNVKVNDLIKMEGSDIYQLDIRNEISKTFGRRIKLLLCSELLDEYIKGEGLSDNDFLFKITPIRFNEYLKRIFKRVLGTYKTKGGKYINELGMYDFRHSSSCYWLPRYKSESALKYRFGWKNNSMIHHYSKLLGMKDTIEEGDLILDADVKTRLEKELDAERAKRDIMEEQITALQQQIHQKNRSEAFVFKFIKGLINAGKIDEIVQYIKDENLQKELVRLSK